MDLNDIMFDKDRKACAYSLMDMGYLNDVIEGYLIEVLRRTDHFQGEIGEALDVLPHVLDTISAEDASNIGKNWRQ